jgi:ubiquinone/menaquinone biosynthesis C-methylase UbiE
MMNRYAKDWDGYSKTWASEFGKSYVHLGDEWNDDGTLERRRDNFYFDTLAARWVNPNSTVLEVGPGGGKWTVRIAPLVKRLIALDVSEEMLNRTRQRCASLGITNVEYILGNGHDFAPIPDNSIDFFFSFDVFVHIALEDTWPYALEMARVLAPGGVGACHHAIDSVDDAWERIDQTSYWYRDQANTLGQFYYYSPESLRRMYERCGFYVAEQHQEWCVCTCIFRKPWIPIVPRLEQLLRQLISFEANDEHYRARTIASLQELPRQLERGIAELLIQASNESDREKRCQSAASIRRIWRGC